MLQAAALGMQMAGSIVSGYAQSAKDKEEAAYDAANAKIAEQQAAADAAATRNQAVRVRGEERAAAGASGIALAGSSFADAMADSDTEAELDAQTQEYNGRLQSRNYRRAAQVARSNASGDVIGGYFGAGTDALGTFARWKGL
jgi:hypothetical protein